jgi:hypothetical protein
MSSSISFGFNLYAAFHGGDGSLVARGVNQAIGADLRIFLIPAA